ncbi:MAG: RDD family protein [Chloroflexi bacterium]|nr:RDD family protein [Chloroflexota bacterium]
MTDRLAEIQNALDSFQRDEARALLKEELKESPSAAAYYLAAQAARTEGDRVRYLRKALELDPDYQPAIAELGEPTPKQKPEQAPEDEPESAPDDTGATEAPQRWLASISKRWLAIIIDGFIVAIATVLLLVAGGALAPLDAAMASADQAAVSAAFSNFQSNTLTVNLLISAIYNVVLMVGFNGQTLGKMMLRLRVVKKRGGRITILDALLRNVFGYMVSQIFLLGYLWALFDAEKQTWHDKMAGTVVVEERRAVSV